MDLFAVSVNFGLGAIEEDRVDGRGNEEKFDNNIFRLNSHLLLMLKSRQ